MEFEGIRKYAYPSAGSTYSVETYLTGEGGECYWHDARQNRLVSNGLDSEFHATHLQWKLGPSSALAELYPAVAQRFAQIEAGAMLALIQDQAANLGMDTLTSCSQDDLALPTVHFTIPEQVLGMPCGSPDNLKILVYLQHDIGCCRAGLYKSTGGSLENMSWVSSEALWTLQPADAARILYSATFVVMIFGPGTPDANVAVGRMLQRMMLAAARSEPRLGLCPLGRLALPADFPHPSHELTLAVAGGLEPADGAEVKGWSWFLSKELSDTLPFHMLPRIVLLPELPQTVSGKLDAKALTLPEPDQGMCESTCLTAQQQRVADYWRKVSVFPVSKSSDFFLLGGDSKSTLKLRHLLQEDFGIDVSLQMLWANSSLAAMSEVLHSHSCHSPALCDDMRKFTFEESQRQLASWGQRGIFEAETLSEGQSTNIETRMRRWKLIETNLAAALV